MLPVADRHNAYAEEVAARLGEAGLRARVDDRTESIGRKIRDAELAKMPYMLVVGDREAEAGAAALRRHREGDLGTSAVDGDRRAARRGGRRAPWRRGLSAAAILDCVEIAFPHRAAPRLTARRTTNS